MIGKSAKSGEKGYIDRHHILEKKYRDENYDSRRRVKLTAKEHKEIHYLTNGLDKNGILSVFFSWFTGKNYEC